MAEPKPSKLNSGAGPTVAVTSSITLLRCRSDHVLATKISCCCKYFNVVQTFFLNLGFVAIDSQPSNRSLMFAGNIVEKYFSNRLKLVASRLRRTLPIAIGPSQPRWVHHIPSEESCMSIVKRPAGHIASHLWPPKTTHGRVIGAKRVYLRVPRIPRAARRQQHMQTSRS